jgi:hypothetical protein
MWTGVLLLSLVATAPVGRSGTQAPPASECTSWQDCRDQVETALAEESYQRALDLAWRAVQRGPRNDPALMFLLARAQARAGRPQDALVMIRRLAERGAAGDALTHADLERTRELDGWAEVAGLITSRDAGNAVASTREAAAPKAATATPAVKVAPPAAAPRSGNATAGARSSVAIESAGLKEEALRFSTDRFIAAGLAYDAVSRRFVLGDQRGRKLRVVGEGLDHAVDLVRAESAGFFDVRALAIDTRRGDLWVASSDDASTTGTLHRIQLISGRPLQALPIGEKTQPAHPVDLAVASGGAVFLLDRDGRILRARPGRTSTELVAATGVTPALSLALAANDTVAYVTHAGGIVRVDIGRRRTAEVSSTAELPLTSVECLRVHLDGFVALQRLPDGSRRLLRLELNRDGRAVRAATVFDVNVEASAGPPALAVTGDELALVAGSLDGTGEPPPSAIGPPAELVVRRFRLP